MKITEPLQKAILSSSQVYSTETISQQHQNKQDVRRQIQDGQRLLQEEIKMSSSATSLRAIELAEEKGASLWLTAIPLREYGFNLHKSAFRDAIALRYGWTPADPSTSCVCGSRFSVEHALSCSRGAFPIIRHYEIRDLTASVLTDICQDLRKLNCEVLRLLNASEKPTKRRLLQADKVLCESVLQMTMSTRSFKSCPQCGVDVHVA